MHYMELFVQLKARKIMVMDSFYKISITQVKSKSFLVGFLVIYK